MHDGSVSFIVPQMYRNENFIEEIRCGCRNNKIDVQNHIFSYYSQQVKNNFSKSYICMDLISMNLSEF